LSPLDMSTYTKFGVRHVENCYIAVS